MTYIIKGDGSKEKYDEKKLAKSLKRAGADKHTIEQIKALVRKKIYNGMTTKELFGLAFREFRKLQPIVAPKYDLKGALYRFGRSGFPFEALIERILVFQGFECRRNVTSHGKAVTHEIDVKAKKGSQVLMVECKHKSKEHLTIHIQTPLYVYARFLDVKKEFTKPMLATNTKFSGHSTRYAKSVGLRLLGWSYPKDDSLQSNIEKYKAYPITMLRGITPDLLERCIKKEVLLLSDIHGKSPEQLATLLGIAFQKAKKIAEQCKVCELK
ncbi:hypothetical protein GF342_04000 [Candidatus Woesearchaeota archaeon]|nr:hypothetical protein [Candidatus Woesearchaeota archaeon]